MADINKAFQLKILADISAYQQELLKLPGVTEKQAARAALAMEREMVKAARATGAAAQAAASGGVDALSKSFGQAKEQVALVAAGVSKVSPELGAVVNTASAAVGVFKAMITAAGPIGVAIAAAGVAAGLAAKAFSGWNDEMNAAASSAAAVKNEILKQQLGLIDNADFVSKAIEANEKAAQSRRMSAVERYFNTVNDLADKNAVTSAIASVTIARAWRDEAEEAQRLTEKLDIQAKGYTALAVEARDAAKAAKEFTESEKETAAWLDEQAKLEADRIARGKKATEDAAKNAAALRSAEREEIQARFEEKNEAREKDAKAQKKAETAETKAALDAYRAKKQLNEQEEKNAKAVTEVRQQEAEMQRAMVFDIVDAYASAASEIFGDTKGGAIAAAIINVALAATKSLTSAPFPVNVALAAATVAAGAAQVQKIQSTNIAHSGLAYEAPGGTAPDESVWMRKRGERMLTERGATAVGGDSQIRRLNAGQAPSMGSSFVGITQFKHKMLDATIGPNIARPAAARTEIKAIAQTGGRVGHRLRSTT